MQFTWIFIFLCLFVSPVWAKYVLTIAHTNDLHAHLLPFDSNGQDCEKPYTSDCRGGYARLSHLINSLRQNEQNLIFLDAGDRFSGTPFYALRKGQDISQLTHKLSYDALTVGNHEFDDGLTELEYFAKSVSAPVVVSNVRFPKTSILDQQVKPSVILSRNGKKIGIIGALSEETKTECARAKDIDITHVIPAVREQVDLLKQQKIDIIIVLSHIGLQEDIALAKAVPDIDIIVGGHSHSLLSNNSTDQNAEGPYPVVIESPDQTKTLIVTAGMGGRILGLIRATFNEFGEITTFEGNPIPLDEHVPEDTHMANDIQNIVNLLKQKLDEPICQTTIPVSLTPNTNFCGVNCSVGQVLSDALLYATQSHNVDIALINAGGLRAGFPLGQVNYRHVIQAYPFDSEATVIELSGSEIISWLEHGLKKYSSTERTNALLHPAGLSYTFNPQTKKIIDVTVQGKPIDTNKIYKVVLPSFLSDGGDGYPVQQNRIILPDNIRSLMAAALKTMPIPTEFENRIAVQTKQ